MDISLRPRLAGTYLVLAGALSLAVLATSTSAADVVTTVNGVDVDNALVDLYLESRTQQPADQATPAQREAVLQELTDIFLLATQPIARELASSDRIRAQLELQEKATIAQAVAQDFLDKNQATDEEISALYESQIKLSPPLQFKARHILVDTQAAAIDLIAQLDKGADFEELAKTHSTGPSGPSGGDLGWFSPDQMVEPFSDAVAALADGAYTTEPVQTQFGWHVILREESRANEPPTLESVRSVIKQNIEQTKLQDYIESLRSASDAKN